MSYHFSRYSVICLAYAHQGASQAVQDLQDYLVTFPILSPTLEELYSAMGDLVDFCGAVYGG